MNVENSEALRVDVFSILLAQKKQKRYDSVK